MGIINIVFVESVWLKTIRVGSFCVQLVKLFNSLPRNIRVLKGCSVEKFKCMAMREFTKTFTTLDIHFSSLIAKSKIHIKLA